MLRRSEGGILCESMGATGRAQKSGCIDHASRSRGARTTPSAIGESGVDYEDDSFRTLKGGRNSASWCGGTETIVGHVSWAKAAKPTARWLPSPGWHTSCIVERRSAFNLPLATSLAELLSMLTFFSLHRWGGIKQTPFSRYRHRYSRRGSGRPPAVR